MGGDCSPARRQLPRGHFEENGAPHRLGDARVQPPVRCNRGVYPLGRKLGQCIRDEGTCFAHQLIEHGIAVAHGHSSHHVKTAEIYSDRLALYDCGDFLNDYEGISGYETFRSDLTLMYMPAIDPGLGQLVEVLLVPTRVARFRLNRAVEAEWLCDLLSRLGTPLGTRGELGPDHTLSLHPFT
jgi:capsule synthesis protein PGA_cap